MAKTPDRNGDGPRDAAAVGAKPTLADVAARVGVSINTVSRALRAPNTVRPQLRREIEAVLDELNYVPNRLAGGLAGGHTGVVGVIITSLFYSEFAQTIDSMQRVLDNAGLQVMLGNSRYDAEEERRLVRAMLSWRPAAIALVGVDHHPRAVSLMRSAGVPVIELWDYTDKPIDSVIGMDHHAIGRMQTAHLLERGYRNIAFIGAIRPEDHRARKRAEGYAAAFAETTEQAPVQVIAARPGHPDLGEQLLGELLGQHPRTDAVICNGDVMAMGVLRGLRKMGRLVPGEIGVIGFGNAEASSCMAPTLTSIQPPRAAIGERAAEAILARIDGEPSLSHAFEAQLVARESTAGPLLAIPSHPPARGNAAC